jgi:hypothetical protein
MPDFNAVMIIGHFVVSIFQIPLGQPLYQFMPFPSMDRCQEYIQYVVTPPAGFTMDLEYKMYKTAECITKEEFQRQMELFNQQQSGNSSAPVAPKLPENKGGW